MAAARGAFSFAAITAADIANFGVAVAAQLNVFSTYFETRMSEQGDPDLSQDMGDKAREQAHAIEQAIEIKMEVSVTEMANRITRVEMRNGEIASVGDIVVNDMGSWTAQAKVTFVKQKEELEQM